ncbi:MAG: hypothetical protein BWY76_03060 [bacterium ADurb.Bin429]|nr:MAG: hypothetical protein BWY76_03060 [bacterium ADurb.Bin429]
MVVIHVVFPDGGADGGEGGGEVTRIVLWIKGKVRLQAVVKSMGLQRAMGGDAEFPLPADSESNLPGNLQRGVQHSHGATVCRRKRAGDPTITLFSGTSRSTVLPMPIRQRSPMMAS